MADVQRYCPDLYVAHQQAAQPTSALRVSNASAVAVNHHLGHMMGGVRVFQANSGLPTTTGGAYKWKIHRHPNADYLCVILRLRNGVSEGGATGRVKMTAGAGTAQTYTTAAINLGTSYYERVVARVPYHTNDSGVVVFSTSTANLGVQAITVVDWPRETVTPAGDHGAAYYDGTYPRCGLREGDAISDSVTAGARGILGAVKQCWSDFCPSVVQWSCPTATGFSAQGSSYANFFGGQQFRRRAPQKAATDTRTTCAVHAWAWGVFTGGGTEYALLATSANPGDGADDTAEVTGQTNTAGAWVSVGDLEVDCTAPALIKFEGKTDDVAGIVRIGALSIVRKGT